MNVDVWHCLESDVATNPQDHPRFQAVRMSGWTYNMMKMAFGCIESFVGRTLGKQVGAQWRFEPAKQSDPDAAANTILC